MRQGERRGKKVEFVLDHTPSHFHGIIRRRRVMIDAIWLLGSRATLDYGKAASTGMLSRLRHEESEQTMNTATIKNKPPATVRRIGCAATVLIVCPPFVIGGYSIFTSPTNL